MYVAFFSRWVTQALDRGAFLVDRIELCSIFWKLVDFNRESYHLRFFLYRERE
jgi:hypothetical protein